ncbi:MAG: heavy-metal-associated domain-containing protein [Bacteroidia bacterium]|nr:heavy-metal-associated domain-containing protein [Bacteroidia bacterium]
MKTIRSNNISKIALLLLMFISVSAFSQDKKKIQTSVIKTNIYCDHCKQCETCGDKFHKKMYNEDGIKSVEVDPKANTITVIYDTRKVDLDKIRQYISELGYDADEIKADPAAVEKLDGCCKKS